MANLTHLVFDLETLSTEPNAVVLSLGCVPFVFEEDGFFKKFVETGFFVKFDVQEQIVKYKRNVEADTVNWWREKPKDLIDATVKPSKDDVSIVSGLNSLNEFISKVEGFSPNDSYVFSRGPDFDFPIIKSLYRNANLDLPYNFWKVRDIRTAIDIMYGTNDGKYEVKSGNAGFIAHNPLHDAAMDAARLVELYQISIDEDIPF